MTAFSEHPQPCTQTSQRGPVDRISFDGQARTFEFRAGMPDEAARQVADAVPAYAGIGPADLLVEIGAGTGLIGQWLARQPIRYLGMDNSQAMLDVFEPRLPAGAHVSLRHADANGPWPVADGGARAIFGSRVFHLLDIDHLLREATRVADPAGAALIQGIVELSPDSPKTKARIRVLELLRARGLEPRLTRRLLRQVLERAEAAGGTILPAQTVATWHTSTRPTDLLDDWRQKGSMGGMTPPAEVAVAIMKELDSWAAETWSDPAQPVSSEESYVLRGVQLPPRQ